jgi:drug/metabolite transporter (DMT)-like permease
MHVNLLRLGLAIVLLSVFNAYTRGLWLPLDASFHNVVWLAVSGIIGFVIGDYCLFKAFEITGARVAMLIMTLSPLFAALAAWIILGEKMVLLHLLAMVVTLVGIALVVFSRKQAVDTNEQLAGASLRISYPVKGIMLGIIAAAGQGIGLVISKYGMQDYNNFAASQIRVMAGFAGFALLFALLRKYKELPTSFKNIVAMRSLVIGSFFGPFLGVSFSLLAVQHADAGVAQTIMSLVPVLIIPPAVILNKEAVTVREILGAIVAVCGAAMFFL